MSRLAEDSTGTRGQTARRRIVLLGASNLTMGIGSVLDSAARLWPEPLEILAALGHGRSYGRASRVFVRQLPGILESGLWNELARHDVPQTYALVTDIGNDLLYEYPVDQIVAWLEACFDRLAIAGARTVVMRMPVFNLETLSPARFRLFRHLFFPRNSLSLETIRARASELDEEVLRLAEEREFKVLEQRPTWYGFDPIHIRPWHAASAWREITVAWLNEPQVAECVLARTRLCWGRTLWIGSRAPDERQILGISRHKSQPSCHFRDGTTLAIY